MSANPILCAIDTADLARAQALVAAVRNAVGGIKLGLEFFTANGPAGVGQVVDGETPLFLDLKLHDIPNTVARAVRSAAALEPLLLTLHTAGGPAMSPAAPAEREAAIDWYVRYTNARAHPLAQRPGAPDEDRPIWSGVAHSGLGIMGLLLDILENSPEDAAILRRWAAA